MFERFSHVMLFVKDFNRALKWYTDVLGCKVNYAHAPHYASLRHEPSGARLDLHPTEADAKDVGFGPMPYFAVKNVNDTVKALQAKGIKIGKVTTTEGGVMFATFWDSEGNALGIEQMR